MSAELIDLLWECREPLVFVTKEQFVSNLEGWKIEPVIIVGEIAYITAIKGPSFHFQNVGKRHRITLRMIKDFLKPIIDEHGYAETHTPKYDGRQRRFNERFGFRNVGEDEYDIHYRIDRA